MLITYPAEVQQILDRLEFYGHSGYIVGGCVRDVILGKKPYDWDICTSAQPEELLEIFESFKTILTGLEHGTVTIAINGQNFEVTTYRIEKGYSDNRRPDKVEFTDDLIEDLSRRDFTINAMAHNSSNGLIDPFNGINDLENKLVVSVGNPKMRFEEDSLRILRGVRFASQLGFEIHEDTFNSMKQCRAMIQNISQERIRDEFIKIILADTPSYGIKLLEKLDIIDIILPELKACIGLNQKNPNHSKDVFKHIMAVMDNTESNLVLRLAALFHDIGKPECFSIDENGIGHFYRHHIISMEIAEIILKRLRFDNRTIEGVKILVKEHMSRYDFLRNNNIRKFIRKIGTSNLDNLFKLQIADIKGSKPPHDFNNIINLREECERVIAEKQPLSVRDLEIDGNDIIRLGYKPGKEIGKILNYLLELVLENPELNKKETLIQLISNNLTFAFDKERFDG
ncbi:CCA tRNA nucleotidyltransferase [Brassicibacter mesophilus]|uniref:CCA tRNA nucleotidyltransferase n=1 Tax=Brassicibacter mesophilus TaxID=745119 RepID=UPI003D1AFB53